jgi:hypothetical protein
MVPGRTVVLLDDMIFEVLLRLPVKSILRFRAICRSWAALFSSKDFCSLHMATSKQVPHPEPKLLVVSPHQDRTPPQCTHTRRRNLEMTYSSPLTPPAAALWK